MNSFDMKEDFAYFVTVDSPGKELRWFRTTNQTAHAAGYYAEKLYFDCYGPEDRLLVGFNNYDGEIVPLLKKTGLSRRWIGYRD